MIYFHTKDITSIEQGVIAHGVNCQGVMGSGVAKAIRYKWPIVYREYKKAPKGNEMLGVCKTIHVNSNKLIVCNCYTQIFYGFGGKFANPKAIYNSIRGALVIAEFYNHMLWMPRIGAGLGGLNWDEEVYPLIKQLSEEFSKIDINICDWPPETTNGRMCVNE